MAMFSFSLSPASGVIWTMPYCFLVFLQGLLRLLEGLLLLLYLLREEVLRLARGFALPSHVLLDKALCHHIRDFGREAPVRAVVS